jgi:hypothetical protein
MDQIGLLTESKASYKMTTEAITELYAYNREYLMESDTLVWWAELHWNYTHLLDCIFIMRFGGRLERAKRMGSRVLNRWANQELSRAFFAWNEWCRNSKMEQAAAGKVLARWRNKELTAGFNSWRETASEMADQEALLRGAMTRWQNQMLSAAYNKWQDEAESMRERKRLLRRGVLVMLKRQLSMAFSKWKQ